MLDLCEPSFAKTHHPLDGHSLAPILRGERDSVRKHAISYWRDAVSIRSASHRLVAKVMQGKIVNTELYDLRKDIDTVENIADEEPEIVAELGKVIP